MNIVFYTQLYFHIHNPNCNQGCYKMGSESGYVS